MRNRQDLGPGPLHVLLFPHVKLICHEIKLVNSLTHRETIAAILNQSLETVCLVALLAYMLAPREPHEARTTTGALVILLSSSMA